MRRHPHRRGVPNRRSRRERELLSITSSTDSDSGHLFIGSAFSWVEGLRPGSTEYLDNAIAENVVLERIAPGPVTIRATLALAGGGHMVGNGVVKLNGTLRFAGCQIYASKDFTSTISTDLDPKATPCGQLIGSALVVTTTYEEKPADQSGVVRAAPGRLQASTGQRHRLPVGGRAPVELFNATPPGTRRRSSRRCPSPARGARRGFIAMLSARSAGTSRPKTSAHLGQARREEVARRIRPRRASASEPQRRRSRRRRVAPSPAPHRRRACPRSGRPRSGCGSEPAPLTMWNRAPPPPRSSCSE